MFLMFSIAQRTPYQQVSCILCIRSGTVTRRFRRRQTKLLAAESSSSVSDRNLGALFLTNIPWNGLQVD